MPRRQCKGEKASGGPCTRSPLRAAGAAKVGLPEEDQDYCASHHPLLTGSDRFGSSSQASEAGKLGGRPKQPTATEVYAAELHRRVGDHVEELVGRLVTIALDAERTVVVGTGPNARTEIAPDQGLQLAALRELNDRILGRPKQQTEVTGAGGGPVELVEIPNTDEYRARVAALAAAALGVGVDDR